MGRVVRRGFFFFGIIRKEIVMLIYDLEMIRGYKEGGRSIFADIVFIGINIRSILS